MAEEHTEGDLKTAGEKYATLNPSRAAETLKKLGPTVRQSPFWQRVSEKTGVPQGRLSTDDSNEQVELPPVDRETIGVQYALTQGQKAAETRDKLGSTVDNAPFWKDVDKTLKRPQKIGFLRRMLKYLLHF